MSKSVIQKLSDQKTSIEEFKNLPPLYNNTKLSEEEFKAVTELDSPFNARIIQLYKDKKFELLEDIANLGYPCAQSLYADVLDAKGDKKSAAAFRELFTKTPFRKKTLKELLAEKQPHPTDREKLEASDIIYNILKENHMFLNDGKYGLRGISKGSKLSDEFTKQIKDMESDFNKSILLSSPQLVEGLAKKGYPMAQICYAEQLIVKDNLPEAKDFLEQVLGNTFSSTAMKDRVLDVAGAAKIRLSNLTLPANVMEL